MVIKKVNSKYNDTLYINMEKLLNELVIEATIDADIIYTNKADLDTIDILTKRYNPKKKYSKLSVQIFNDLNKLSGMVKKRNGKTKVINGSAIILNEKDRQKRINLLRGLIIAGNDNKNTCSNYIFSYFIFHSIHSFITCSSTAHCHHFQYANTKLTLH